MTDLPRITALMPIRNGMRFLTESRAVIDQSLADGDELLVIDDNSTDGTSEFLDIWQKENSQVRAIKNKSTGLISALKLGVNESQNNWIARYDVDDQYDVGRLKTQREAITSGVGAIFSDYEFISADGKHLGIIESPVESHASSLSLINSNRTPHPSVLFSREVYFHSGGYRDSDYLVEDLSLWLRMSRQSKLISVPKVLLRYKLHQNSVSAINRNEMLIAKARLLKNIGINPLDIAYCVNESEEIYRSYKGSPGESRRRLLYFYDFVSLLRTNLFPKSISKISWASHLREMATFSNVSHVNNLRAERRLRSNYRAL